MKFLRERQAARGRVRQREDQTALGGQQFPQLRDRFRHPARAQILGVITHEQRPGAGQFDGLLDRDEQISVRSFVGDVSDVPWESLATDVIKREQARRNEPAVALLGP